LVVRCQRYSNVYGARRDPSPWYSGVISRFAHALANGRGPTIFGDHEQTRDFVAVFDVARANALAATRPGIATGAANICTGRAVSLNTLCSVMGGLCGARQAVRYDPARVVVVRHSYGSPQQAECAFGFVAAVGLAEGFGGLVRPTGNYAAS
jgi:UDP-glucose 4-epimerase